MGIVRIDKIISYTSYFEQTVEQPVVDESGQPSGEEPIEGKTTSEHKGVDIEPKSPEYEALKVGQEVPTSFLLTSRPVKVRYVSIPPVGEPEPEPEPGPHGAMESEFEQLSEESADDKTVESPPGGKEPLPKTYKPISIEEGYFVFTTKIIEYPETSQKILSGLEIGSKFHARIHYSGSLYIEEYEGL